MRLPSNKEKFNARFKYVEIGRYVPDLNRVIRIQKNYEPVLLDIEQIETFRAKYNNLGLYTSIFQYDDTNVDSSSCLGSLCFDLDSSDLEIARAETLLLVEYLSQYISDEALRVYFSGGKGFHIECEAISLNISPSDDLPGIFRFIAKRLTDDLSLTSTDLVVYDQRRMWRLANSQHQRTGLYKVECLQLLRDSQSIQPILDYATEPRPDEIPEQSFDPKANRWFRELAFQYEQHKIIKADKSDLLARFLEHGVGNIKVYNDDNKVFDKFKLFKNCSAVRFLVDKAHQAHHLEHYERLFLCSLLTYTPDAIKFLHEIFAQCSDYNPDITNAHIEDWIQRREYDIGGRPFTCEKAKQVGIICSDCDKMDPRQKVTKLTDGRYIEIGEFSQPSPVRHCYTIPKGS